MKNKLSTLASILSKLGYQNESLSIHFLKESSGLLKTAIGIADAEKALNSKKVYNAIKNYTLEKYKNNDNTYQELLNNVEIEKEIDSNFSFFKKAIKDGVPNDLNEKQKALSIIWIRNLVLSTKQNLINFMINPYAASELNDLEYFFHYNDFMEIKDLMQIINLDELQTVIENAKEKVNEYLNNIEYLDAEKGMNKIYEDGTWKVFEIHNKGAACEIGKDTKWCTASPGLDFFKKYYKEYSPLFVFINKNTNDKYQFSYSEKEFKNADDEDIPNLLVDSLTRLIMPYLSENYGLIYNIFTENADEISKFYPEIKKYRDLNLIDEISIFKNITFKEVMNEKIIPGVNNVFYDDFRELFIHVDNNFNYHRLNGPAVEHADEYKEWWINGKRHREDGPAIEYADGRKEWWINGKLHREDGPALEYPNGTKKWYINGELHREGGPAVELANGIKMWYINDRLHREDGPARETADGYKEWWLNGKLHREDGPAVEFSNGTKMWYVDDRLHREDDPAIEKANGTKEWWLNGKLHREDGPAVEYPDGVKEWYLHDLKFNYEDWKKELLREKGV